jgi:hypothetical protein
LAKEPRGVRARVSDSPEIAERANPRIRALFTKRTIWETLRVFGEQAKGFRAPMQSE